MLFRSPVVNVLPIVLVVAAVGLWSQAARDWFAGRSPRPVEAPRPPVESKRPWAMSEQDGQPPVTQPVPQPTPQPAAQPGAYPRPYGGSGDGETVPPAPAPEQPVAAPQQSYPGQPYPPQGYPPQPYAQQPYPGQAYPQQPYGQQPYPGQPYYPVQPGPPASGRPSAVIWAAILTWVMSGLVLAASVGVTLVALVAHDDLVTELGRQMRSDDQLNDLGITAGDMASIVTTVFAITLLWSLAAIVIAVFMFRGHNWARITLAVSAGIAALVCLIAILSIVSLVPLAGAVATIILMFTRRANGFFRGQGTPNAPGAGPSYAPGGPW